MYVHLMNKDAKSFNLELKILNEINKSKNHSQRSISKNVNVALGLANAVIRKLVKKGLLKLQEAPMRRYFYYLTPKGFIEKSRLTKEFLESSLEFYSKAKDDYETEFNKIKKERKFIILAGMSELTEIAILSSKILNVEVDYIFSPKIKEKTFCGLKVLNKLDKDKFTKNNTNLILTEFANPKGIYNLLIKRFDVLSPKFLMID